MSLTDDDRAAKQHDLEESPKETALRLIRRDVKNVGAAHKKLSERGLRHARYLTIEEKRDVFRYLERKLEATRTVFDGLGEEEEFDFFSSPFVEDER